jgi:metal-dependent amidase/aminoacylase/carboxypeptidase family protein
LGAGWAGLGDHPLADPILVQLACGHNAQIAGLMGPMGLLDSKALQHPAGRIVAFAVPAEEYDDVAGAHTRRVRASWSFWGKPELCVSTLDDVDLAMMIHTTPARGQAGRRRSDIMVVVKPSIHR